MGKGLLTQTTSTISVILDPAGKTGLMKALGAHDTGEGNLQRLFHVPACYGKSASRLSFRHGPFDP